MPGEVLEQRWRIETRIGQGAMGSVFRGKDLETNAAVAIKILAPEHCRKQKIVARFEREAAKMIGLRHPNIVAFHGHGRRAALPFIVMEFLEGFALSEVLEKQGGTLDLPKTITIVKQMAAGLAFLHHHHLVHRDVKPQNVFLCFDGRVVILDLGVVRDIHNPGLTRPGAMVGTPYYMSPEQILGIDDIDNRTDVYALAAVTFEFLTGRPPYTGSNNFEVLYGHKTLPPPNASELVSSVPQLVSQVLSRGLAKEREDRPDTVTELVADLEAAAGEQRVDLAKAMQLGDDPSTLKTRLLPKVSKQHIASAADTNSDEAPMPIEPVSAQIPLWEAAPGGEKTVIHRVGKSLLGPAPNLYAAKTKPQPFPTDSLLLGQLHVAVTAKEKTAAATVFVNGVEMGVTPQTFTLRAGPHQVRIELPGFRTVERWANVASQTSTQLRVFLEKN